jgi:WhiB family transcriptional regulator, redox-sensing transcriptional regulator
VPSGAGTSVDWRHAARCRDEDPETLFVQGAQQRDAREVCTAWTVRTECLAHALDNRIRFGVWGGMTERERRALLKRRPDVISWAALLESARRAAAASPPANNPANPANPANPSAPARPRRTARPAEPAAEARPAGRAERRHAG